LIRKKREEFGRAILSVTSLTTYSHLMRGIVWQSVDPGLTQPLVHHDLLAAPMVDNIPMV